MKIKHLPLIFFLFFLFSCTTIKFGEKGKVLFEEEKITGVRELNLSYQYKVMGIPVKGEKSITEALFVHPLNKTVFIFISFPRVGILKSDDNCESFTANFFKLSFLEKSFGYQENKDNEKVRESSKEKPQRFFYHFAYSPVNTDKSAIAMGPYVFLTKDNGRKWDEKNIFFDMESVNIRELIITEKEEIIVITENRVAYSKDWGKKWETKYIKVENNPFFKTEFISGVFDDKKGILYASFKFNDEQDNILSQASYDLIYNDKKSEVKTGLFYSTDLGKTWNKTGLNIPLFLWKFNDNIYGSAIYPLSFYNANFSEDFKKSSLYRYAALDSATTRKVLEEYANKFISLEPDDYLILSAKNNKIFNIEKDAYKLIQEKSIDNIYEGMKKLESTDYINWNNRLYTEKRSNNFFYEYNFLQVFKRWTGMRINNPSIYLKINERIYRTKPDIKFMKAFTKYFIEKQIELNSKNPFLKKTTDFEFFEPALDPTNGFPCNIEYSSDNGKSWKVYFDSDFMRKIIDPLATKRSGFYWYKNVDQKKLIRLQLSFGFEKGASFLVYPDSLGVIDKELFIRVNYFAITKSYKDVYLAPEVK